MRQVRKTFFPSRFSSRVTAEDRLGAPNILEESCLFQRGELTKSKRGKARLGASKVQASRALLARRYFFSALFQRRNPSLLSFLSYLFFHVRRTIRRRREREGEQHRVWLKLIRSSSSSSLPRLLPSQRSPFGDSWDQGPTHASRIYSVLTEESQTKRLNGVWKEEEQRRRD